MVGALEVPDRGISTTELLSDKKLTLCRLPQWSGKVLCTWLTGRPVYGATSPRTCDTELYLHSPAPQRHWRKPQIQAVGPIAGTEERCNHSMTGKTCHQVRSRENSWLRWIGWSSQWKAHNKLIILRKNERRWGTTLHVCWRGPVRDSSLFYLQKPLRDHSSNKAVVLSNLSLGRWACKFIESSSMPRTVRHVDGPSSLSGLPSFEKQLIGLSRLC